jgi:cellulose synthase/poly-beta-1,6-N-acetylglucosamine synthase-like glycosyltransferase
MGGSVDRISVVIPAHNEERVIARNLVRLHEGVEPGVLDVVVVCNGCNDGTAAAARAAVPGVRVIELVEPSKAAAVRAGNAASAVFPRVHLDADVQLSGADVLRLVRPLVDEGLLATAPRRIVPRGRASILVRWYYDVWEQLPQVRAGLFGRGAIALSQEGNERVFALPEVLNDDLAISDAFETDECRIVHEAKVTVVPPATLRDLLRRRVRIATGNTQAAAVGVQRSDSGTRLSGLVRLSLGKPGLALRLPVFLGVALIARYQSRRVVRAGDFSTWLRDESSRQ